MNIKSGMILHSDSSHISMDNVTFELSQTMNNYQESTLFDDCHDCVSLMYFDGTNEFGNSVNMYDIHVYYLLNDNAMTQYELSQIVAIRNIFITSHNDSATTNPFITDNELTSYICLNVADPR